MPAKKQARGGSANGRATPKKRVAANGFKLPDPIPAGVIVSDIAKNEWIIGKSIGQGGFGEIYLASNNTSQPVNDKAKFVVKIEPHTNGPLFAEMHCYLRIAKPDMIDEWMKAQKQKRLGMPKYLGSGSFTHNDERFRFMVIERFGSDLQKILENHNKKFSFKTVYQLGLEIIDVLEYIHSKGYIHADIKASNLLVGFEKGTENQVFLVDYGLACRYLGSDGVHKEYKYDGRKAHDGTIEFTSRDAHIGAHSRRGDMEILGYNMLQWLCGRLPWEDNLTDCDYVAKHKRWYMDNMDKLIEKCFPDDAPIPPGLSEFLSYVGNLTFDEKPDYQKCRQILRVGLVERGYKDDGKLVFMSATPKAASKKPKSRLQKVGSTSFTESSEEVTPKRGRAVKIVTSARGKKVAKKVSDPSSGNGNTSSADDEDVEIKPKKVVKKINKRKKRDSADMFESSMEEDEVMPVSKIRGVVASKKPKIHDLSSDFDEISEEKENISDSANSDGASKLKPIKKGKVTPKGKKAAPLTDKKKSGVTKAKTSRVVATKAAIKVKSPLVRKSLSPSKVGYTPAMLERLAIIRAKNELKGSKKKK